MSQAILTSSAILAYVLIMQYGRRRFSWRTWLPAIIGIPIAAAVYLSRAPAHRYDIYLYLAAAAAGCGFGALAAATTGVGRDLAAGQLYTRSGPAFAATWAIATGTRVAFIWALQEVPWFAHSAGPFLRDHQIGQGADPFGRDNAVHAGHADVHQHNVWPVGSGGGNGRGTVGGLTGHHPVLRG